MTNRGVAPLDPETTTGQFRLLYGDTQYVPLDPPEVGYGDYTELSDDEIEMFLAISGNSPARAISIYYIRLAGDASKESLSIKDHDLAADLTKRAQDLLAAAARWAAVADAEADIAGDGDIFEIFEVDTCTCPPEAAPWPVGGCRCGLPVF